eukprot:TRINITY_DN2182_c0_g1_i2.p1 TRINITY_DN2182_c0_g1~~TRINITY_DN2182_c0_g1_i2.p1  ORF type:complete len:555 (+),score=110.91 TRINITY_DN2182_c0_g1_i2:57-1721(+)
MAEAPSTENEQLERGESSSVQHESSDQSTKHIYFQDEIYIHTSVEIGSHINGHLQIIEESDGVRYLAWAPAYSAPMQGTPMFGVIPKMKRSVTFRSEQYSIKVPLKDIVSVTRRKETLGTPYMIVSVKGGYPHSPFYFHKGGFDEFFEKLHEFLPLINHEKDPDVLVVVDDNSEVFAKLLSGEQIIKKPPTARTMNEGALLTLESFQNVYRVASLLAHKMFVHQEPQVELTNDEGEASKMDSYVLAESPIMESQDGFEVVTSIPRMETMGSPPESSTTSRPPIQQIDHIFQHAGVLRSHRKLTLEFWNSMRDSEGRIDAKKECVLKKVIFLGGVDQKARTEVWPFIIGLYPFQSTVQERIAILQEQKRVYSALQSQWKNILPQQEENFTPYKDRKSQIEKDVARTDRTLPEFEVDGCDGLRRLHDILLSYSFYNWDLGYVQGMNDLLSPLISEIPDEDCVFACFLAMMETLSHNFRHDQKGIHSQLDHLRNFLRFLDPALYYYFGESQILFGFLSFNIHFKKSGFRSHQLIFPRIPACCAIVILFLFFYMEHSS